MRAPTEDLVKITAMVETALDEVSIPDTGIGLREHPLSRIAAENAITSNIGRIVLAGRTSANSTWVQFNIDNGGGYASTWPEWAFAIARDALLNDKKVWVLANGDPFGGNLVNVLLYAP
ncbi:hypothetical protein ACQP2F_27010 [Actinoplanes sp. CA-030573]|uniref:hypothetical protein n=1 Tax=Actinoplanes sp. CA-030573 TaxID=3239898 RepID=UPI003D93446A